MSDPLERLSGFRVEAEGGPMLPATELRERGDRIRRRRHAVITAGSTLAVAAVVVPAALLVAGGTPDRLDPAPAPTTSIPTSPAPTPSVSPTAPPTSGTAGSVPVTVADLMTEDDTIYDPQLDEDVVHWVQGDTFSGDGQAVAHPCQRSSFDDLGADIVWQRDFVLAPDEVEGLHQAIAQFGSAADAEAAFLAFTDWLADCSPPDSTGYAAATELAPIPVPGQGTVTSSTYDLDVEAAGESYANQRVDTGLVVSGDRLTVLTHAAPTGDYWPDGTPVAQMLPIAAEILQPGDDEPSGPTDPDDGGDPGDTTDPTDPTDPNATLTEDHLVGPDELQAVPGLEAWQRLPAQSTPTLICQGDWLRELDPEARVLGEYGASSPAVGYHSARVNVAVLQFADRVSAGNAYAMVLGWLADCPAAHSDREPTVEQVVTGVDVTTPDDLPPVDRAHRSYVVYPALEVCVECDATWHDYQTVVQVGERLVLVSYALVGDPCATAACLPGDQPVYPEADAMVATAVDEVVARAVWDLR